MGWTKEECYQNPDVIFSAMIKSFQRARKSIDFETFIFERDEQGERVLAALISAANRGVKVRLLVDGIGSPQFSAEFVESLRSQGVRTRIYRPWGGFVKRVLRAFRRLRFREISREVVNMNRRDHRKIGVVDGRGAWLGSANVSARHAQWRETAVYVEGPDVSLIAQSFDWVWHRSKPQRHFSFRFFPADSDHVNSGYGWSAKRKDNRFRRQLIDRAERRVRLINPYFIPPLNFLLPLLRACRDGIRVEIMLPKTSDYRIIEWISRTYYEILLRDGAILYEYEAGMLHSKILIVDDAAIIGSSNYNFRSFYHDLELDILVDHPETIRSLSDQWKLDLERSRVVDLAEVTRKTWFEGPRLWLFAVIRKIM